MEGSYFIPGVMSEDMRDYLGELIRPAQIIITEPVSLEGYLIPVSESESNDFRRLSGLRREDFLDNHPTNLPNVSLINYSRYRGGEVTYEGKCQRIMDLLQQFATSQCVNIVAIEPDRYCFSDIACRQGRNDHTDHSVYVHFNCAGEGRARQVEELTMLYDIDLKARLALSKRVRQFSLIPNATDGHVVYDTHGTPVAEVVGGHIYVLVNIMTSVEVYNYTIYPRYWRENAHVLEKILKDALPVAIAQQKSIATIPDYQRAIEKTRAELEVAREQTAKSYSSIFTQTDAEKIELLGSEISELRNQVEQARRNWISTIAALDSKLQNLNDIRNRPLTEDTTRTTEFFNILEIPEVVGIEILSTSTIRIHTDTIYIDYESMQYRIGNFQVDINHRRKTLSAKNMYNTGRRMTSCQHPHVHSVGQFCLGNISEAVNLALIKNEFEMLVTMIIQFLKSYDRSNPFATINNWQRVV